LVILWVHFAIEFSIYAQQKGEKNKKGKERKGGTEFILVPLNGGGHVTYRMAGLLLSLLHVGDGGWLLVSQRFWDVAIMCMQL
jgi:hypothetical protein